MRLQEIGADEEDAAVRQLDMRDLGASFFSQAASLSAKGSSLLGRSGTVNVGSMVPAFMSFLIVLHDRPVRRAISRMGSCSRRAIRRMTCNIPM